MGSMFVHKHTVALQTITLQQMIKCYDSKFFPSLNEHFSYAWVRVCVCQ